VEKEKEKQPGNKFLDSLDSSLISLLRCFIRFSQLSRRAADSEVSKTRRDHYEKHFCLHLFPHVLHHPPNCLAHTHRPPPLTTLSLSLLLLLSSITRNFPLRFLGPWLSSKHVGRLKSYFLVGRNIYMYMNHMMFFIFRFSPDIHSRLCWDFSGGISLN
jgi:hypothetical protein